MYNALRPIVFKSHYTDSTRTPSVPLVQVPSNMMLAWCGKPSLYLGTFICLWGTVSACTGAVQSFGGLVAVRLLLGATEAPFFPGALYLLSKWYTRTELSVRMALLYAASLFSNAVAGLIAAGVLGNMEGVHGIRAWRWLFILIGAITVGCGFLIMLILPDFPHSTKKWFFTEEELKVAVQRLEEDAGSSDVEGQGEDGNTPFKGFVLAVKDPKVWMLTFMLFAAVTGLAFNAFFPSLVKTLGYGKIETLLLTTPPWAWAFICVYLNALHADKTGERFWHLTVPLIFGIVGFIIDSTTLKTGARFFGMFICASSYAGFTTMLTWASNTIPRPAYKRAAALAIINCVSNAGNIAGSYIWPSAWGPSYWRSNLISACCFVVAIFMALVLKIHLTKLNKELDRINGEVDKATPDPLQASGDIESDKVLNDAERVALAKRNFRYLK